MVRLVHGYVITFSFMGMCVLRPKNDPIEYTDRLTRDINRENSPGKLDLS